MKELIGLKVKAVYVNKDAELTLIFVTNKQTFEYSLDADCCSESWFADIIGVENLLGAVVSTAEAVELLKYNVADGRCRQESDSAYGYKLITNKGHVEIIFRNSSNGYYGGNLREPTVIETFDKKLYTKIIKDWSAQ